MMRATRCLPQRFTHFAQIDEHSTATIDAMAGAIGLLESSRAAAVLDGAIRHRLVQPRIEARARHLSTRHITDDRKLLVGDR